MGWATEARKHHDEGRRLVSQQEFARALICYEACVQRLQQPDSLASSNAGEHGKLLATALANAALCCLKLEKWEEATVACTHCLEIDPQNAKAFGRRGLARTKLVTQGRGEEAEGARSDLHYALQVDPQDQLLLRAQEQLEAVLRRGARASRSAGGEFSFSKALAGGSFARASREAPAPVPPGAFGYPVWHASRLKWMGLSAEEERELPDDLSSGDSWDDDDEDETAEDMAVRRVLEAKSNFPSMPSSMPLGRVMRVARRLWDE